MQKNINISFDVGFIGCSIKIQQVWQYNDRLYVLSKFAMPRGLCPQSEERIHDSVSVELDKDLPISHYLIIATPLDSPFEAEGYEPEVIEREMDIPEEIRTKGKSLYKIIPLGIDQIIDDRVNHINQKLRSLIGLYSYILGKNQQISKNDIENGTLITELLCRNEHSRKEKYTLMLLFEIQCMIDPSINDIVLQRLNLPKVDTTRLKHLAKKYSNEIIENGENGISNITDPDNQPDINPQPKPQISRFKFFEPLAVAATAIAVTAAICKFTS